MKRAMRTDAQVFSFRGSVSHDAEQLSEEAGGAVLIVGRDVAEAPLPGSLAASSAHAIFVDGRPDSATLDAALDAVGKTGAQRIAGIGDGSILDVVKIAAMEASARFDRECRPILVPTGREAYRAAAPFAVLDTDGERPTRVDPLLASGRVFIVDEVLALTSGACVAVTRADIAVIAIESMQSQRSTPFSRELAAMVLSIASDPMPGTPSLVAVGSIYAAEAMMMTRLGLSHALASPLGTITGHTHDVFNAILGPYAIRMLGSSPGLLRIARAMSLPGGVAEVVEAVDGLRVNAQLPSSLREVGVTWEHVQIALPKVRNSSGIAALPRPLTDAEIEEFARSAWEGRAQSPSMTEVQPRAST